VYDDAYRMPSVTAQHHASSRIRIPQLTY